MQANDRALVVSWLQDAAKVAGAMEHKRVAYLQPPVQPPEVMAFFGVSEQLGSWRDLEYIIHGGYVTNLDYAVRTTLEAWAVALEEDPSRDADACYKFALRLVE
jgi:hypothetical protein